MAQKYSGYGVGYALGIKISGASPVDNRFVVEHLQDLYSDDTWKNAGYDVYQGLVVSVLDVHEIYMFTPDDPNDYDYKITTNWRKVGGASAAIFAVNIGEYPGYTIYDNKKCVVEYINDKYYRLNDTAAEREPVDPEAVIKPDKGKHFYAEMDDLSHYDPEEWGILIENHPDVTNYGAGTYIKVEDEDGNITYSKVRIDLAPIQDQIDNISSNLKNVSTNLQDLSTNFKDLSTNFVDLSINFQDLSTNFVDLSTNFQDLSTNFKDLSTNFKDLSTNFKDLSTNFKDLSTNFWDLSTAFSNFIDQGFSTNEPRYFSFNNSSTDQTVQLNASIAKSSSEGLFPNVNLATDGYVNERLSWILIPGPGQS